MIALLVTTAFEQYNIGDIITDGNLIVSIEAGPYAAFVVRILYSGGGSAEGLAVVVVAAVAGQPVSLAGTVTNASPAALDFSTDGGTAWGAVTSYVLIGSNWSGNGPTFATAGSHVIVVRDHVAQTVVSPGVSFNVAGGGGGGGGGNGALVLADGSVINAVGVGLTAGNDGAPGPIAVAFGVSANMALEGSLLGSAGGVAPLDGMGKLPAAVLPASLIGAMHYFGAWDAAANMPPITSGQAAPDGLAGAYYVVATGGATAVDGVAAWAAGDWIVWDGTRWDKLDGAANPISSVAGRQGAVTLSHADLTDWTVATGAFLPSIAVGAANGVAPLDGAARLPQGNLPNVAAQAWADPAASAAIFRHGPVPTPPVPQTGLTIGDKWKIAGEFNFAEVFQTQQTYDAWPALQKFLLYAQLVALAMKTSGIDNLTQRSSVRVILPRGAYLVSQPLIVPEYVELDGPGTIFRAAYTGDQSNNGTTSVPGPFATNQFLPTVVIAPRGHAKRLNIYVNTDGNIAHRGSGVCIGKNWAASVGSTCAIGGAGSGYSAGDKLFMAQPSVGSYFNWGAQVVSVNGTGGITSATVFAAGAYSLPPVMYDGAASLQQQQWTAANGFAVFDAANPGCFLVHSAYHSDGTTPSAGIGATLAPVWQADYVAGTASYNIGSAIVADTQIGKINVTGAVPAIIDATHGPTFCVMISGLNIVIDEVEVLGGNSGVLFYFANDARLGICNVVEAGTGMQIYGSGSVHCPQVVFDTCGAALLIDESQGIYIKGRAFFEQGNIGLSNVYPNSLGNAIKIGAASSSTFPNADIHIDMGLVNMGGLPQSTITAHPGTAIGSQTPRPMAASVFLAWLFSSRIDVRATNIGEQGGAATILPTSGFCQFGFGVDAGNEIRGSLDTIPTIDGVAPPAQIVTSTSGHGYPGCACRVWDGLHGAWVGVFGVSDIFGTTAPVSGTAGTGAGFAAPGSSYINTTGGAGRRYVNTNTMASPTWA